MDIYILFGIIIAETLLLVSAARIIFFRRADLRLLDEEVRDLRAAQLAQTEKRIQDLELQTDTLRFCVGGRVRLVETGIYGGDSFRTVGETAEVIGHGATLVAVRFDDGREVSVHPDYLALAVEDDVVRGVFDKARA